MHMTIARFCLPRRWAFPSAQNDNVADADFSAGSLDSSGCGESRLPPFTSILIWSVLAIAGWGSLAAAIRWL
jgi:hypothetical protein